MTSNQARQFTFLVVTSAFVLNMIARGIGETFAVFLLPIEEDMGWRRSQLTAIYAIYMGTHGISGPLVGWLNDKLGPRKVYTFGLVLYITAAFLASQATEPWHLYVSSGFMFGLAMTSMSMTTAAVLLSRWYKHNQGNDSLMPMPVSFSLVYAGLGAGAMLFPFIAQLLITSTGWRATYQVYALGLFVALIALQFLPWKKLAPVDLEKTDKNANRLALKQAIKGAAFWFLFAIYFMTAFSVYLISPQLVAFLVSVGFSANTAALVFSTIGFLTIFGMAATGLLADKVGVRNTATISFIMTASGFALIYLQAHFILIFVLLIAIISLGLSQGARGPVISVLIARLYPGANLGLIHGTITMGIGLGGMCGAFLAGRLFEISGGYDLNFALAIVAALTGIALFWLGPFQPNKQQTEDL